MTETITNLRLYPQVQSDVKRLDEAIIAIAQVADYLHVPPPRPHANDGLITFPVQEEKLAEALEARVPGWQDRGLFYPA